MAGSVSIMDRAAHVVLVILGPTRVEGGKKRMMHQREYVDSLLIEIFLFWEKEKIYLSG